VSAAPLIVLAALAVAAAFVAFVGFVAVRRSAFESEAVLGRELRRARESIEALQHQRDVDARILNGLGEGVLAVDAARRIVLANQEFGQLFGVAAGPIVGRPLHEVVRVSTVFEGIDRALRGGESVERFGIRAGIAEKKIEMRTLPLRSPEIAAVALFIDVTHIERLETIRRNFLTDFSHEARTPLTGLRSAVDTYEGVGQLTEEEERQLRRIMSRQLLRMERLVDDISELSRIEAGDLTLERIPIDLRGVVDELCEDFAERAAQHDVRLEVSGGPAVVLADPLRVQQAFSNLIDNAIKYGGDERTVTIEVSERADSGVVRVIDEGEGIPESERENVFRRFYRIDKSRSQEIAGSGLGLAITKHLVLQHRGTIDVESEPGGGAAFIVTLPKHDARPQPA
jgi:two-component system phosphate regulon sensor histidine kinase PhoR